MSAGTVTTTTPRREEDWRRRREWGEDEDEAMKEADGDDDDGDDDDEDEADDDDAVRCEREGVMVEDTSNSPPQHLIVYAATPRHSFLLRMSNTRCPRSTYPSAAHWDGEKRPGGGTPSATVGPQ